ncbi:hypothetical protein TSUD_373020 [Trifolium subterraneum]|uniref:Uncharacterized protein n=1 Tax=Trifolium subterraneum TaxID=3900 RepID=A0A2Z6PG17_TRISU|nr:hypothetical protein TSUD_373020 [Trifolium subterraneum]
MSGRGIPVAVCIGDSFSWCLVYGSALSQQRAVMLFMLIVCVICIAADELAHAAKTLGYRTWVRNAPLQV